MAKREVTVVINGEEYVSKAADDAAEGMNRFTGKIGGWFKSFVDLKAAFDLAVRAAGFLKDQIVASFDAFDAYRASLQKLEGAAKLTGTPLQTLVDLAKQGQEAFKLSAGVANDFAAEVAKLASKAGDVTKAKDALAAFLEIGAARGLSSAQTLQAVQQAILGIDEGTDKLFGKNPSVIYAEFAASIGTTAGKLTDQQKAQALLTETIDSGLKVQGTYAQYLETSAGKQEQMNNSIEAARVSFGAALDPLRALSLQLGAKLMPVLTPLATFIAQVLTLAFTGFGKVINIVYGNVGLLAYGLGRLTGNQELRRWGKEAALSAEAFGAQLNELSEAAYNLGKQAESTTTKQRQLDEAFKASTTVVKDHGTESKAAHDKVAAASKAAAEQLEKDTKAINENLSKNLGPPLKDAIRLTEGALKSLGESAKVQLDAKVADEFARNMERLGKEAANVRTQLEATPEPIASSSRKSGEMAQKVGDIARSALDLAGAFGVVNDQAAATLNSVINIGVGLARVAGGDAGGFAQIISASVSLIARMMGGDRERARLINDNTEQLKRLTEEVGNLSLDVTGEDFAKIQTALTSVFHQLQPGRGARNQADIFRALQQVGLNFGDVTRLAQQLGIQVTTSSGAISVEGIRALLDAMGMTELGKFGQSFTEQLRATRAGFEVSGFSQARQLQEMLGLAIRFMGPEARAVARLGTGDLALTRANLMEMFAQFQRGGFTAGELGGLTGQQFLDLVMDLIRRIDDLAASTQTVDVPGAGDTPVGSTPNTVRDAVETQTTTVSTILTEHTGLHTRIAVATERTAVAAEAILVAMRTAIATNAMTDAVDQGLEQERRQFAAQRGFQLGFGG